MIRKYSRLDASPETLRAIFRDVERWPSWMPGVDTVEILESAQERALIVVRGRPLGRVESRKLEIRFDEYGYSETQISGRMKSWKAIWRFSKPPAGESGTVVSTQIDLDLGMLKYLFPRRRVQRTIDRLHEEIVDRAEARARRRETLSVPTVWGVLPDEALSIRVYETPTELEIWFGERRFVVPAAE